MKRLLDFFPASLPNESLHSRMSRYHQLSGNFNSRYSIEDLFDEPFVVVTSHLPNHLARLSEKLPPNGPYDVASLIDSSTLFPYFRPFLTEHQISKCIVGMNGDDARAIKMSMGVVASRIGAGNNFRYCKQCMLEDDSEFGISYWHRPHLLPGVVICHLHQIPLHEVNIDWVNKNRSRLFLPTDPCLLEHTKQVYVVDRHFSLLLELAHRSSCLLQSSRVPIDRVELLNQYRCLAKNLDLIGSNDRLRIPQIRYRLQEFMQKIPSVPDFVFTRRNGEISPHWVHSLIRDARSSSHPMKHVLLSLFLRDDQDMRSLPPLRLVEKESSIPVKNPGKQIDPELLADMLGKQGHSLTYCAKQLGISVTTLKVAAIRLRIPMSVPLRPKVIDAEMSVELQKDLVSTASLKLLAQKHNISEPSLYRILKMHPDIADERAKIEFDHERLRRREIFIQEQKEAPSCKRTNYIWLYRNDRVWLNDVMRENRRKREQCTPRVDWEQRDQEIVHEVQITYLVLSAQPKPIRVTQNSLVKSNRFRSMIKSNPNKLPQTLALIAKLLESVEEFQLRRVIWQFKKLKEKENPVRKWKLIQKTGLKTPLEGKLKRLVEHLIDLQSINELVADNIMKKILDKLNSTPVVADFI